MAQSYEEEIVELRARLSAHEAAAGDLWRDNFAMRAMTGLLTATANLREQGFEEMESTAPETNAAPAYARVAYAIADAMLAERAKGGGA